MLLTRLKHGQTKIRLMLVPISPLRDGGVGRGPRRAARTQRDSAAIEPQENIQQRTSNAEHRTGRNAMPLWELEVGSWRLDVLPSENFREHDSLLPTVLQRPSSPWPSHPSDGGEGVSSVSAARRWENCRTDLVQAQTS